MTTFHQLTIRLERSNPEIWRRIQVRSNITLFDLHHIIQIVMGWTNSHLYEFRIGKKRFGTHYDDEYDEEFYGDNFQDASEVTLTDLKIKRGNKILYLYDFGDYWEHLISVDKVEKYADSTIQLPVCTEGEMNCPPEDCGGIHGFYNMLQILNTIRHPERREIIEWYGKVFNPNHFDIRKVNKQFRNTKPIRSKL
ncbi:MAG: plasmid pRiA4b ORF-3 family protein [Saprospiraceae bacterium]